MPYVKKLSPRPWKCYFSLGEDVVVADSVGELSPLQLLLFLAVQGGGRDQDDGVDRVFVHLNIDDSPALLQQIFQSREF